MSGGGEGKKQPPVLKNLFRELGEPMLCMRAELSQKQQQQQVANPNINAENKNTFAGNNNNNNEGGGPSSSSGEKVLLRTRVLLHEAYQCQGGNIITWCEPFHAHGKKDKVDASTTSSSSSSNPLSARPQQQQQQGGDSAPAASSSPAGVDLALSFQDNAGCKDIWQHILNVQSCAREMTTHFANNNNATSTSSSSSSMSIHSPLSPIKVTTFSTHAHPLHNSPNSPDHDYVEDKLIAGGGGGGGSPLGGISSRPSIWTNKDSNSIGNSSSSSSSSTNVENRLHSHNHALPSNKSPYSSSSPSPSSSDDDEEEKQFHDAVDHMTAVSMAAAAAASYKLSPKDGNAAGGGGGMDNTNVSSPLPMGGGAGGGGGGTLHGFHMNNNSHLDNSNTVGGVSSPLQLPESPTWDDLQNIGDVIAGVHLHQREDFLIFLSQSDCAYIKLLLNIFPPAEGRGEDMTELAVIIKTILLLNDPEIIEYVTSDAPTFESVCAVLEYDPELREKANHREFIQKCAKFRTVVKMEDDELVSQIHHLFRVTYLRDNVLRPTMDESSLSTLVSLAQFTQSDIIKGVITAPKVKVAGAGGVASELPGLSYLTKVVRLLAVEIDAIRTVISGEDESNAGPICQNQPIEEESDVTTMWQQHLAPQDSSLSSRHIRRKGCLMFLKELFCKARVSLQQPEKDEFIESCVSNSKLLYLLGAILSDPNVGVDEQGAALEMVSVVAMHDPCVIRRHCLQGAGTAAESSSNEMFSCLRPDPNDHREVIFICPPNDLLLSILFVMSTAADAGILLQTSEIIRIILDTDIVGDQGTSLNGSFMNEENDINAMNSQNIRHDTGLEEQNSFLALFYDRYIQWLVAPFQYKLFISKSILPLLSESNQDESFSAINRIRQEFKHCSASEEKSLTSVAGCAVRSSFTLEILSFCVRAHVYRMKFFILRTRLLGTILKMLCQKAPHPHQMASGGKCLKLASLKFLRSVLSVKDEFYHRHIVQYNLFAPVFDAFRITPVGRNLISSAVLEMCDFIRTENIKSLLEYIVTKHLTKSASPGEKSLEDIANPHVDTFAQLRRTHEENIGMHLDPNNEEGNPGNDGATFNGRPAPVINKKALEDQRKYREAESEDSYFNDDDDDDEVMGPLPNDENASSLPAMSDTASLLADVSSLE
ncbi:serine/threonine-protein phosphatase 4 regulatory subunit 3 [Skeletonema marinoi]|uniref:Serine/threonine-protein phosphatase 4 regulatory subunit 3 n=1 Tax=Skeletonema marinoi TaxID=267567 RepID=A0AAD8XW35_9STRA|nr:serine/threonine-protein phosphatase 4 regulatory subunit 3 [Skeletonema marinoi]